MASGPVDFHRSSSVMATGDVDLDGVDDAVDNCRHVSNPSQANQDGDEYGDACEQPQCVSVVNHWNVLNGDSDCDGYPDSVKVSSHAGESSMGTDAARLCAATPQENDEGPPDAWPVDFNDDQLANGADILRFNTVFGTLAPGPPYSARFDLNGDALINGADILQFNPFFGHFCNDVAPTPSPTPAPSATPPPTSTPTSTPVQNWVTAWGRTPLSTTVTTSTTTVQATVPSQINNQTLRTIVWTTIGGSQVRVKFTNRFSSSALVISAAHVGLVQSGGTIQAGSDRTLTFGGNGSVTIAAGAEVWSDAVTLSVGQHVNLAISTYLPGTFTPATFHPTGLKTSYLSPAGNFVASATMPVPSGSATKTTTQVLFASEVQVLSAGTPTTIVALGDSITDGACSNNNANGSWPDLLSARLPSLPNGSPVAVVNAGIGSNRFQASDGAGLSGLHRLADALAEPGVKWVVLFEGINDISYEHATPAQIIAAYQTAIAQIHAAGVGVIGIPMLPIEHSTKDVGNNEATREAVNTWIRTSGAYDHIIDFDPVMADPADPLSMKPSLTCDHVHPNQAGYQAMANSIDLTLFN
jgi:lysophospholipase L1-like esterase